MLDSGKHLNDLFSLYIFCIFQRVMTGNLVWIVPTPVVVSVSTTLYVIEWLVTAMKDVILVIQIYIVMKVSLDVFTTTSFLVWNTIVWNTLFGILKSDI